MLRSLAVLLVILVWTVSAKAQEAVPDAARSKLTSDLVRAQTKIDAALESYQLARERLQEFMEQQGGDIEMGAVEPMTSGDWMAGVYGALTVGEVIVTNPDGAFLFAGATAEAAKAGGKVAASTTLPVIQSEGGWYATSWNNQPGWVSAADVTPTGGEMAFIDPVKYLKSEVEKTLQGAIQVAVDSANQLRQEYAENEYFAIPGFSINLGIPPSVTINFDFK